MRPRSDSTPSISRGPSSQTPRGSGTIQGHTLVSREHTQGRAEGVAGACPKVVHVLHTQCPPLIPATDPGWLRLLQQLLVFRLGDMQACLGQSPEGLCRAALCKCPTLDLAGACLLVQQVKPQTQQ